MTDERACGGNAFPSDTMDLARVLGVKRPVVVAHAEFREALSNWVGGDGRRLGLVREIVRAHRSLSSDEDAATPPARDGDGGLANDLSGFLLAELPALHFTGGEDPGRGELLIRMWSAIGRIAFHHPMLFDGCGGQESDVEAAAPRCQPRTRDHPRYDEADFWAAAERPRVTRRPRAIELDPDAAHLARELDLRPILSAEVRDVTLGDGRRERSTPFPGITPIVETSEDGSTLEFLFGRTLQIPREVRRRHVLVVGKTGCGKTTRAILPLLRGDISDPGLTVVVLDTKGELLPAVRAFTRGSRPGQDVRVVQFRDPERSLGWNPLTRVRTHADAFNLAHLLCHAVDNGVTSGDSVFWINSAIDLLAAFFVALKRKFGGQATIADALRLCDLSVRELGRFSLEFPDLDVLGRFASYVGTGSHNAETIIADLRMRLVLWRDENVAAVTSADEIDLEDLCATPAVLVLQVPEEEVEAVKPVLNAFLDQLLSTALGVARVSDGLVLPVQMSVFIEEFASSVGRIPKIERRLNTIRHPGISITASVQTISQIEDEYDTAFRSVMAGFSTRVVFPDCTYEDARWFSVLSGETTVIETTTTVEEEVGVVPPRPPRRIRSERPVPRPLLTPGEIQRPPQNQMLGRAVTWFLPDLPPFPAFLTPLYMMELGASQLDDARRLGARGPLRTEALVDRRKKLIGGEGGKTSEPRGAKGISDSSGWSQDEIRERIKAVVFKLDLEGASRSASTWWREFVRQNEERLGLVLRLAEELLEREATVMEFFMAYMYSSTNNIQANLHYFDYRRLKLEDERKEKEAAREKRERESAESARAPVVDDLTLSAETVVSADDPDPPSFDFMDPDMHADEEHFDVCEDQSTTGVPGPETPRAETATFWLRRMAESRWTYARTATESGLTIGTLRYWKRKHAG